MKEEINKILKDIFEDKVQCVCRNITAIEDTTDNFPAIGFHTDQKFNQNLFFNFLIRNLRTQQLIHPNYFSFYIKHETSNNLAYVFKISILPINSEISEEKDFPIFQKEIINE